MKHNFNDALNLQEKVQLFTSTFTTAVGGIFLIHLLCLSIYAFAVFDWSLVVSGFDFSKWSVLGRSLILIPYILLPATLAVLRVMGFNLASLRNTDNQE